MIALTDCSLVYLNDLDIERQWPKRQIDELRETMRSMDLDYIVDKINRFYLEKSKRNVAVLDAAKINGHDFSGARSGFMQQNNQT